MHKSINDYLEREPSSARLLTQANLIWRLNNSMHELLPAIPASVANIKAGRIIIYAEHGLAAAKIRQLQQRLLTLFQRQHKDSNSIFVKIQPQNSLTDRFSGQKLPKMAGTFTKNTLPISADARQSLRHCRDKLAGDSQLAQALDRLIEEK